MLPNPFYLIWIVIRDIGYYTYLGFFWLFYWLFWTLAWSIILLVATTICAAPVGIIVLCLESWKESRRNLEEVRPLITETRTQAPSRRPMDLEEGGPATETQPQPQSQGPTEPEEARALLAKTQNQPPQPTQSDPEEGQALAAETRTESRPPTPPPAYSSIAREGDANESSD